MSSTTHLSQIGNTNKKTHTCSPVSDYKEERVIGHDLGVQYQSPRQGDHS